MTWRSAHEIVRTLKGRWAGKSGTCRCPAHEDRSPSLSVTQTHDGRVLVRCHAGCDQMAVIDALKRVNLWPHGEVTGDPNYPGRVTTPYERGVDDKSERARRREAQDIWDRSKPLKGSLAEAYLHARGIRRVPDAELRFVPSLAHSPSSKSFPAMISRVSDNRGLCAVQRTYLSRDGGGKADVKPNKMSKGPMGEGAVRLFPVSERLGLAEGVETALSAAQLYSIPTWATLSANRLAKIEIPKTVKSIIIFADVGDVGVTAAFAAQDFYERDGIAVDVVTPQAHYRDSKASDFNDVLRGHAA